MYERDTHTRTETIRDAALTTDVPPSKPVRQVEERIEAPVDRRRFSLGATFLGWSVATFFSLLFLAVLVGAIGGTAANDYYFDAAIDDTDVRTVAIAGVIGYLVATFLAYLVGGYAAGRISLWDGAMHGALTVTWMVLAGLVLLVAGAALNEVLNDFVLIGLPFSVGQITGATLLWALGSIAAAALGGAVGGRIGERYHDPERAGLFMRRRSIRGRTV